MPLDKQSNQPILLPFLKWAGGKRWLTDQHPDLFDNQFNRYIEPFLGSGAVFFKLTPNQSVLCDRNTDLIDTYQAIKDDWQRVQRLLKEHHRKHCKEYYYHTRDKKLRSRWTKAARFIYLNRTCWNGLYRVNLKGKFNVPIGTKTNVILDTDNFKETSRLLQNTNLLSGDFEQAINQASEGDFVFVDPPYTVKHNFNGFIKYNEGLFSWEDQIRLRDSVERAVARGAKVLVTNAYHECIQELYSGVGEQIKLTRASVISGKASARGKYEEMIIKCF